MIHKTRTAFVVAGVIALGGCGTDDATNDAEREAEEAQEQAQQAGEETRTAVEGELSPDGQQLLEEAEGVAADIAQTADGYADDRLSREEALAEL